MKHALSNQAPKLGSLLESIRILPDIGLGRLKVLSSLVAIFGAGLMVWLHEALGVRKSVALTGISLSLIAAFGVYYIGRRVLLEKAREAFQKEVYQGFAEVLAILNRCHFYDAERYLIDILIEAPFVRNSRPQFFELIDEMLLFFTKCLLRICEEKEALGREREITQQAASLEQQLRHGGFHLDPEQVEKINAELTVLNVKMSRFSSLNQLANKVTKEFRRLREELKSLQTRTHEKYDVKRYSAFMNVRMAREQAMLRELERIRIQLALRNTLQS